MTSVALLRTLGELIRAERSETGLTQGELGARAGIGGKYGDHSLQSLLELEPK